MNYKYESQIAKGRGLTWQEYSELARTRIHGKTCLHCASRFHTSTHQYCLMRPSQLSATGYKRVRAHDDACGLYEMKKV